MGKRIVIIGGVAGGASAAARLRRLDEEAEIILVEKGSYISYANCGLPYYIGDIIKDKETLLVSTPESMSRRFRIDVRVNSEATAINPSEKTVEIYDKAEKRSYSIGYDKLILSPGAEPVKPRLKGIDSPRIYTLRNIPDTYKIKAFVDENKPAAAVIVGAGFIGLEVAENLSAQGIKVTVVELSDHVIGPLDFEMAAIVHQHIKTKGIELYLKDGVESFEDMDNGINVQLSSGRVINTEMVIMGIGVRPETKLARNAGLTLGSTGGIYVNDHMQTSDPDIYAVGDAVQVKDFISGDDALIPLAGPANKQGRIAADNISGRNVSFGGTQGTSIVKIFDITAAVTGSNERSLIKKGIEYEKSITHSASHAGYYPGAIPMAIKLLFSKADGKLLGAQIIGYEGVDKRIDVLATAIRASMTVYDLETLELAYAPPFSSAKDPVNIAGYTASNILKGDLATFHWDDVAGIDLSSSLLIDVRTPQEYSLATIKGAINIPVDDLRERLDEIPKDKGIYVFCQVGLRGYLAGRILMQHGYTRIRNLSGGYKTYHFAAQKQSSETAPDGGSTNKDAVKSEVNKKDRQATADVSIRLDACGLQCPGPIIKVYEAINKMEPEQTLEVKVTDPGFPEDIKAWCAKTGNSIVASRFENNTFTVTIKKGEKKVSTQTGSAPASEKNGKSIIVFSNDLDKTIASFIIANGAAAMGRKVTMFFTFWGLNILRKPGIKGVKKDFMGKMFGRMMPKGSGKLSLSKLNMAGTGPKLIRHLMKKKNIASLEELIAQAQRNGVEFVACNMSMDIMGIKKEELIDGVTIGGVASFLGSAEESDMSLFI